MIRDNLEYAIYSHISQTGKDVNLIVMHPKTAEKIWEDVFDIYNHEASLKYRGIRVLRSLDISEGLFEVR